MNHVFKILYTTDDIFEKAIIEELLNEKSISSYSSDPGISILGASQITIYVDSRYFDEARILLKKYLLNKGGTDLTDDEVEAEFEEYSKKSAERVRNIQESSLPFFILYASWFIPGGMGVLIIFLSKNLGIIHYNSRNEYYAYLIGASVILSFLTYLVLHLYNKNILEKKDNE